MAVSPMMQQYLRIKEQYKDAILFFQMCIRDRDCRKGCVGCGMRRYEGACQ